ncbi:hypothetical protein T484DRAFT_1933976 [Baffinella frigidus]|nr:hypothetical protein T484DRAFT_1933976 [Cryptophyta sp. CCMP2293]
MPHHVALHPQRVTTLHPQTLHPAPYTPNCQTPTPPKPGTAESPTMSPFTRNE